MTAVVHRVSGAELYGWCGARGLTHRQVTTMADLVSCATCREIDHQQRTEAARPFDQRCMSCHHPAHPFDVCKRYSGGTAYRCGCVNSSATQPPSGTDFVRWGAGPWHRRSAACAPPRIDHFWHVDPSAGPDAKPTHGSLCQTCFPGCER